MKRKNYNKKIFFLNQNKKFFRCQNNPRSPPQRCFRGVKLEKARNFLKSFLKIFLLFWLFSVTYSKGKKQKNKFKFFMKGVN